jgi:PTS system mannose-specific IID component
VKSNRNTIGIPDLLAAFGRLLLLQASWSFDRMQTAGFAYAIEPALKKIYPNSVEYESRLKLHFEYFNTQPYFASFILGAAIRLEHDRATGKNAGADVSGLKAALMAPLGALGDSFFWGALKPMAAVAAVALAIAGSWWAPVLFLIIFNIWHLGLRLGMLFWGYNNGGDAVALMARYRFTIIAKRFKVVSLSMLGGIIGMIPLWNIRFRPTLSDRPEVLALPCLFAALALISIMRRGGSPVKYMLGLAATCLALAYLGVI